MQVDLYASIYIIIITCITNNMFQIAINSVLLAQLNDQSRTTVTAKKLVPLM